MTYTDIEVLESFTLGCLTPGMLHFPPSFEVFEPFLARMSRVCTGECPALLVHYVHTRLPFLMLLDAAHTRRPFRRRALLSRR